MKEFRCYTAQRGFFAGPVFRVRQPSAPARSGAADPETEIRRLHEAEAMLRSDIAGKGSSGENAKIRETVLDILSDEAFSGRTERYIREGLTDAPSALKRTADELADALGSVDSEYIRSRREDIRGVAEQLMTLLEGKSGTPEERSVICAAEISPARLSAMDEEMIGALLTEKGSPNSHASILAGNLGVPYLYGNSEAVRNAGEAAWVIVDSDSGTVITDPDEPTRREAELRMKQIAEAGEKENAARRETETAAGCRTRVYANIEGPDDIGALLESGADGVGLFRTEFLFLGKDSIPTEEEQTEAYRRVLEAMGEKEVIIRTMDIGSDKKAPWLELPDEANPALGLRGVRVSLEREELFNTQLRALLRAGVTGNLKVMFPMIASAWEIDEIRERIGRAAAELKNEGIGYRIPEIGIMVETPAAALCAEELAEKVGFFSIGTNDLTQYTLALDREARGLERYFNPRHEAVYRLIRMTAEAGKRHGIPVGVCGQLGADPEAVEKLIGYGVDELSVPVRRVRETKRLAAEAEKAAAAAESGGKQQRQPEVAAVADGELIPMVEIPDPVFSGGSLGQCFGILPENGKVYSPASGTVLSVAETGHAFTVRSDDGKDILVHVGINTVNLGSRAFTHYVTAGDRVERNQLILEADLKMIRDAGLSTVIVVALLNESTR